MHRLLISTFTCISLTVLGGCASTQKTSPITVSPLYKFALANCMFKYFETKGYDTDDIRAISGGIVETSDISIDKIQAIALFISEYNSNLETKSNIDSQLNTCFNLEESKEFRNLIDSL